MVFLVMLASLHFDSALVKRLPIARRASRIGAARALAGEAGSVIIKGTSSRCFSSLEHRPAGFEGLSQLFNRFHQAVPGHLHSLFLRHRCLLSIYNRPLITV
jgi:hypothetical protein